MVQDWKPTAIKSVTCLTLFPTFKHGRYFLLEVLRGVLTTGVIIPRSDISRLYTDCRSDTWGFADVEAAVAMIVQWTKNVSWEGPSVNANRWLVSGHSNGGECNT